MTGILFRSTNNINRVPNWAKLSGALKITDHEDVALICKHVCVAYVRANIAADGLTNQYSDEPVVDGRFLNVRFAIPCWRE